MAIPSYASEIPTSKACAHLLWMKSIGISRFPNVCIEGGTRRLPKEALFSDLFCAR
jgi:hypothetical protein